MFDTSTLLHGTVQEVWNTLVRTQSLVEVGVAVAAMALGLVLAVLVRASGRSLTRYELWTHWHIREFAARFNGVLAPFLVFVLMNVAVTGFESASLKPWVLRACLTFSGAWTLVRTVEAVVVEPFWTRIFAWIIWGTAILDVVQLLQPTLDALDRVGIHFNQQAISLLTVFKGVFVLSLLLPASNLLGNFLRQHIEAASHLTPRVQVLVVKCIKTLLFLIVVMVALNIIGLDVQVLAVFSGAVGLGLGFGLQKVVSNLFSGIILLMDNSIRPGDVIEVDGVHGRIRALNARYVSMVTRDGTSFLIPNDQLITNRVINWSHTGQGVRLKLPVSVGYTSDIRLVMELMIRAALEFDRVTKEPSPASRLLRFGNNSFDLELRLWIKDPEKGVVNIESDILLRIWELFQKYDVVLTSPQVEVSFKEEGEDKVAVEAKVVSKD